MNNRGQALVEYLLIIVIISVIVIAIITFFGGSIKDTVTKTACSLSDSTYIEGLKPGEGKCDKNES